MPNWSQIKSQYQGVISRNGVLIQVLTRTVSEADAYDTGSTTSYGYGDPIVTWTTGSARAIVAPIREEEVVVEAGFYLNDYKTLFLDPDTTITNHDQVIYPSGSSTKYIVKDVTEYGVGASTPTKYAMIRRLIPRSGSSY